MLDMARAREVFEESQDFTVGIEEEFQILDPDTLALSQRFEELYEAGLADDVLEDRVAGESKVSQGEVRKALLAVLKLRFRVPSDERKARSAR